ncbi:antibiotic biosynthesis monooxygenase [Polymorphobacter multimanifer]|uniref:Quinol monooxygenase YgiN n=1 Tax=Polymorphobacter multimanifer TaxID=1070431 RepID=A0A841LJ75_9SPHN|nr:antibiotic biosynthesis monooxygenase [Polymorphobacter multimanifer]MBB6229272.1 quinol monooxygenase YgiN [Polymorphobacter multimanifer]GGI85378.1 antibiotic biosynthesis monooxygenase [Polymorphobacter multimanifer]
MSVSYLIEFAVLSVERERFLILLNGVLDMMRGEKMFVNATLHADPKDENRFLLHETWSDHDDVLDVQLHKDYRHAWHEALPTLLQQPRSVSLWTPLRYDRTPRT